MTTETEFASVPRDLDKLFLHLTSHLPVSPAMGKFFRAGEWYFCRDREKPLIKELNGEGYLGMEGPHGFQGDIFRNTLRIVHVGYWHMFLDDPVARPNLRTIFRDCAKLFSSQVVIYYPSEDPGDHVLDKAVAGASLSEIEEWLLKAYGPPAKQFEDLRELRSVWARDQVDKPDARFLVFDLS